MRIKNYTLPLCLSLTSICCDNGGNGLHTELLGSTHVVINELMQSNIDCYMDDLNEFPDSWVELYNLGSYAVNLNQFKLGESSDSAMAWPLPDKTLEPKKYAVIFCDKVGYGMHTDFRLKTGKGCKVYLFQNGSVVDSVCISEKQPSPNIAYGREKDGSGNMGYLLRPTPGRKNCGRISEGLLGKPLFSEPGGVFTDGRTIILTLSLPVGSPEGTEIRYTTNGSEPNAGSTRYSKPIHIKSNTVVRARLFRNGYLSPRATVQSYLFFPSSRPLTLPVVSIVTNKKYLNDSKIGIYTDGSYQADKKNYEFNWRRPINLEYFEEGNQPSKLNQLCETRVMGGNSRDFTLKSLVVYAHKRFGTKRFDYEFFPDQRPGLKKFKSLQLRNAGNDFNYLYMRDAMVQRTMASHVDLDWQAWRPAITYINGVYLGILNIRERANEDNIYSNYDGLDDIDLIENWCELKKGDWENYNAFKQFYTEHGHTLSEYEKWMDCEEFINLMLMNLYFNNLDFPGSNIVMWRPRSEGGRWRWIAKDCDFTIGLYEKSPKNYQIIKWLYNPDYDSEFNWGANSSDATRLFRRLMEDEDFKREFIDHALVYMGDFLNEKGIREIWDPMYETIKTEYPYHRTPINSKWPNYDKELESARTWVQKRTEQFYQQLADFYQLGTYTTLVVNNELDDQQLEDIKILANGIPLSKGKFDGKYIIDRTITLEGQSDTGKEVHGWDLVLTTPDNKTIRQKFNTAKLKLKVPAVSRITINAVVSKAKALKNYSRSK